jgi:hypothetical protein
MADILSVAQILEIFKNGIANFKSTIANFMGALNNKVSGLSLPTVDAFPENSLLREIWNTKINVVQNDAQGSTYTATGTITIPPINAVTTIWITVKDLPPD